MAIEAVDFCLAVLDRGKPLGIKGLLARARKYKLGLEDYDIRRAVRALRDQRLITATRSIESAAFIFRTTPEGEKRAKRNRRLVRLVFRYRGKPESKELAPKQDKETTEPSRSMFGDAEDNAGMDEGTGESE